MKVPLNGKWELRVVIDPSRERRVAVFCLIANERIRRVLGGPVLGRLARQMNWLRKPLAILAMAMVASALCGLFLHPQGFVLAVGLAAVMGVGVLWPRVSLYGLTGSVSFEKERAREGEPVRMDVSIKNRSPFGVWGLGIDASNAPDLAYGLLDRPDASLSFVAGRQTTVSSWNLVPDRRGEYPGRRPAMMTGFPFGLCVARRELEIERSLLVWPRTFPVGPIPEAAQGRESDGLSPRDKPGAWGDLMGVRPYRRGDSLRRIHWPQTARHGQLVVCEVQASSVPHVQIVLDTNRAAHAGVGPDGSLEWVIRIAASFAEGWTKEGAEVDMIVDGEPFATGPGSMSRRSAAILDVLARLTPRRDLPLVEVLTRRECQCSPGGLRVIVTTDIGLRELPAGATGRPGDRFVILKAAGFGWEAPERPGVPQPVAPWIVIDGPDRIASSLLRPGKEAAIVG